MATVQQLASSVLEGNDKAIAKAITIAESHTLQSEKMMSLLFPHTGRARIIGVTGPGGSGKSTLVEKLVKALRKKGETVGVVAVDPTSPFSGGAFLGDRIRMQELSTDRGVFIRSMATRSNPGGVARATKDAVRILDASGKDAVVVETVGAGQSEVDIIKIAHTIVVVLAPGLGDEIQAIKAGLMEIGDIFVVNKADREGADRAVMHIQAMLKLGDKKIQWNAPVFKTNAVSGEGTIQLLDKIWEHQRYLQKGEGRRRQRRMAETELLEAIKQKTAEHIVTLLRKRGELDALVEKILRREVDPSSAAEEVLAEKVKS